MVYVMLAPQWLKDDAEFHALPSVQGEFSKFDLDNANRVAGYGIYYYPNYPKFIHNPNEFLKGTDIDVFEWVFVDMDLKAGHWGTKEYFVGVLSESSLPPTKIIDSGGGIHAYWKVSDLDAMSFLRFNRRLCRHFTTDEAVSKIKQLMRLPGTINTKIKGEPRPCEVWYDSDLVYTAEDLDKLLPAITPEDEEYCIRHAAQTYGEKDLNIKVSDALPAKFGQLLQKNQEAKEIWSGNMNDRSKSDYRLGHIMLAAGFTKDEARSVLINSPKALDRPGHRINYAETIIDKIWTYEANKSTLNLSSSVKDILSKAGDAIVGTRLTCHRYIDATERGFRLGDVIGLVAGSGVGKTAVSLNIFLGFVENNPDYEHFFITLEMPANEVAERWRIICGENTYLHDKVHIISNYDDEGQYRDLSLDEIQEYIIHYTTTTGRKIGCVVIDHIGVLANNNKLGQDEGIKKIAKAMKTFAIQTKTVLIMQSQTARSKAGIGDLPLEKDAAFGTSVFENFTDCLITVWQPLKRCYMDGAPTITAFKFCKIRHKNQGLDKVKEDVPYMRMFNPDTQLLTPLSEAEEKSFSYWLTKSDNKRNNDGNEPVVYKSVSWEGTNGTNNDKELGGTSGIAVEPSIKGLHSV